MADWAHPDFDARHNRGVRMVCVVLLAMVVPSVVHAHPMRRDDDLDEEMLSPDSVFLEGHVRNHKKRPPQHIPTPEEMCERNKSWSRLVACLKKGGNTISILYDLGKGRLV